jgi:OOP family OmpA-OmpF porin
MKHFIPASALLFTTLLPAAMADPYIGVAVGSASYDVDLSAFDAGSYDDDATGTKVYGGYSFSEYLAVEAGFYNFAEASVGAIETEPGSGEYNSGEASVTGVAVYAVGVYPVNREIKLIAKLGALNWDADLRVNDTLASNGGTDVTYSLGASYAFTKELHGVFEWESFDTDNPELSMYSAGFRFVFR